MKVLFTLAFLFILNGCSSLTKDQCVNNNWFDLGKKQGLRANDPPEHDDIEKACAKHGIQIKKENYKAGFLEGLKEYCTYQNGRTRALQGDRIYDYCDKVGNEFREGFSKGYWEREASRKKGIESLEDELANMHGGVCHISCRVKGSCSSGVCQPSGETCNFSSDCDSTKPCETITSQTSYGDSVSVSVCKP